MMTEREDLAQRRSKKIGSDSSLQLAFAGLIVQVFW
jgi:hypothetical protein